MAEENSQRKRKEMDSRYFQIIHFHLKKKNQNHILFLRNKALLLSLKKSQNFKSIGRLQKEESKLAERLWSSKQKSWAQNLTARHLDVLGLYSSNSAFIGISRSFANDLTDFYAIKLEWSILINCSDLLPNAGLQHRAKISSQIWTDERCTTYESAGQAQQF